MFDVVVLVFDMMTVMWLFVLWNCCMNCACRLGKKSLNCGEILSRSKEVQYIHSIIWEKLNSFVSFSIVIDWSFLLLTLVNILLTQFEQMLWKDTRVRISSQVLVMMCLAQLCRQHVNLCVLLGHDEVQQPLQEWLTAKYLSLRALLSHSDPLLRGQTAYFFGTISFTHFQSLSLSLSLSLNSHSLDDYSFVYSFRLLALCSPHIITFAREWSLLIIVIWWLFGSANVDRTSSRYESAWLSIHCCQICLSSAGSQSHATRTFTLGSLCTLHSTISSHSQFFCLLTRQNQSNENCPHFIFHSFSHSPSCLIWHDLDVVIRGDLIMIVDMILW